MTKEIKLEKLSMRARDALSKALAGQPVNLDTLKTISQRDIWIMPTFGRGTSNEIRDWLADLGIFMPER